MRVTLQSMQTIGRIECHNIAIIELTETEDRREGEEGEEN